jgi:hypothetical protein
LNGYFHDPVLDSLAESLLKARGGAVAVWASSGMTLPQHQAEMNRTLYRLIFAGGLTQPLTLGDAIGNTKSETSNLDVRRTWILLGDPAMRLR